MDPNEIVQRCAHLSLSKDDGPVATIDAISREIGIRKVSLCLFGKIIVHMDFNREAFLATISSIWRTAKGVEIEILRVNLLFFRFRCAWDWKRVLEGDPWSVDKQLLVLKEAVGVRKLVGEAKEIDMGVDGDCLVKFIQMRVLIDVSKPLRRGMRVAFEDEEEMCSMIICYERFPNFCYYCNKIGHLLRECPSNDQGFIKGSTLKFGPWIRAPTLTKSRMKGVKPVSSELGQEEKDPLRFLLWRWRATKIMR
ncbi:hypothetical protein ACOSQ4_021364 [Xanthoceras sorbifolium]